MLTLTGSGSDHLRRSLPRWKMLLALRLCCRLSAPRAFTTSCPHWAGRPDPHALLGLKPGATQEQIKEAFLRLSKQLHPDTDPSNPALHGQFIQLLEAYRALSQAGPRPLHQAWTPPRPPPPRPGPDPWQAPPPYRESQRYWEQFRTPPPGGFTGSEAEHIRLWNQRIFTYCILLILGGMAIHYLAYRELQQANKRYMDEKDERISRIYKEAKERARVNGLQKQQELLEQKHAELVAQYRLHHGRAPPWA
ncbi:dnaJ homolog subfamily C member 4 isoform X1 [Alligator mississippiensis]|uniref:DnaJ-like protein subfamily C member 4 isoform A n=1 Tax=Alligator mississippiensis TaxID=8496 RepID=A0A151PCM5_ALLMI|nr:dnaJ homolog subfamily C member 4 isoform X1 [Alligator mississippiensis]KYO46758.1 dnaJ-like protein subfamily C member 4 isoform A [Alligator mississippiensis]